MNGWQQCSRLLVLVVPLAFGIASARADEPLFGFVYTTDLLPKGAKEVEQWVTLRRNRSHGEFHLWEGRAEFSYGVSDRLQLSLYANYAKTRAYLNNIDGTTASPEAFAEVQADPDSPLHASKYVGTSVELIYRILSPYTDPFGFAVYVEPTVGPGLRELESKLIFQKNFLDDRLVLAGNITIAQEMRYLPGDPAAAPTDAEFLPRWDRETDVNFNIGASYRFASNWSAGLELLNEREWSSFSLRPENRTNSAYFLGPNIHYGGRRFFVTATFLKQMHGARDYANPPPGFIFDGRTDADDFERFRWRVKAGFYF